MTRTLRSRRGRFLAGLALAAAVAGLVFVLRSSAEQRSWESSEGTVRERLRSGKSFQVKVEYPLPDGSRQVATLAENGPARHPGDRVTVRYDLENGQVADAALADNDQAHRVVGVMLGVVVLGGISVNVLAWAPRRRSRT
ncbi:DUF3592 domain-containing protein [Lentzea fradiae]|uniref:DUF3592 domain-containing protein n=1 Tax=Lentzea fradiae TaxID=200378 RepID=UPI00115FF768|nr:DUF3592 domain-containing protein [Lentzea fradiae]